MIEVIKHFVGPDATAVDVGAHRGVYTLLLSGLVGPAGRVHAIDPLPRNVASLERLARRSRSVTVHAVAVSSAAGTAEIFVPMPAGHHLDALASVRPPSVAHSVVRVTTDTLDGILENHPVDFVKCDAEGHEDAVLAGARATLSALPTVVIKTEQRHRSKPVTDVLAGMLARGYTGFAFGVDRLRPIAEFDVERDQLRFVPDGFVTGSMPRGYVHTFLFTPPHADVSSLMAGRPAQT
jgi:FkbM family methyltransferase